MTTNGTPSLDDRLFAIHVEHKITMQRINDDFERQMAHSKNEFLRRQRRLQQATLVGLLLVVFLFAWLPLALSAGLLHHIYFPWSILTILPIVITQANKLQRADEELREHNRQHNPHEREHC